MNIKNICALLLTVFLIGCTNDMSEDIERLDDETADNRFENLDVPDEIIEGLSPLQKERIAYFIEDDAIFLEHVELETIQPADSEVNMQIEAFLFQYPDDRFAIIPSLSFDDLRVTNDTVAFFLPLGEDRDYASITNTGVVNLYTEGTVSENPLLYESSMTGGNFAVVAFQPQNITRRSLDNLEMITYFEFQLVDDYPEENLYFTLVYAHDPSFFNSAYGAVFNRQDLIDFGDDEERLEIIREVITFEDSRFSN